MPQHLTDSQRKSRCCGLSTRNLFAADVLPGAASLAIRPRTAPPSSKHSISQSRYRETQHTMPVYRLALSYRISSSLLQVS